MLRLSAPLAGALLLLPAPATAGPLRDWLFGDMTPVPPGPPGDRRYPPSSYGYYLDETAAGYYGGSRYREYYAFGRGYGMANFPGPVPGPLDRPIYPVRPVVAVPVVHAAPAKLLVRVPEGAEVWLEGVKTTQGGTDRLFASPPLPPDVVHVYEVRARWTEDGRAAEQTQQVLVSGGRVAEVRFPAPK
jgi:uncharacterized protein (TIGR03000 family)